MGFWIRISIISLFLALFVFSAAYLFTLSDGKNLLVLQLEDLTHRKVTVEAIRLSFPYGFRIKNLNIDGLSSFDSIFVSPSLWGFLKGTLAFNKLVFIRPQITYERKPVPRPADSAVAQEPEDPTQPYFSKILRTVIKRIAITDGKVNFIDRTAGADGIKITFEDINLDMSNLYILPRSAVTKFELACKIPWQEGEQEGTLASEGWFDLYKKDIQAQVKIQNIDGLYLYPYYKKWIDLEKACVEKARLNFTSIIHGLDNELTADCRLELTDIVCKLPESEEEAAKIGKLTEAVLSRFKVIGEDKVALDFVHKTKLNRPVFSFEDIKTAVERRLTQGRVELSPETVLGFPAQLVKGTFKGFTDMTSAVLSGTIDAGIEICKAFLGAFRKAR